MLYRVIHVYTEAFYCNVESVIGCWAVVLIVL